MSGQSVIAMIMRKNKNWREWFAKQYPDITIQEDNGYALFKYGIGSNFNIPLVREARGIIIDTETKEVVCRAFDKFGKYTDSYADLDTFDWDSGIMTEKIDGSMVKLWWSERDGRWVWSTMGNIYASKALLDTRNRDENHETFMDVINDANADEVIRQVSETPYYRNYTFIFELTSPYNQVVVKYDAPTLWHIGTRDNTTQQELRFNFLGDCVKTPNRLPCRSLDYATKVAYCYNRKNNGNDVINACDNEGIVVQDRYYHRLKVKSDIYMMLHDATSKITKQYIIQSIMDNQIDISAVSKLKNGNIICYYYNEYIQLMNSLTRAISNATWLYSQCESRKEFAELIKNYKYKACLFTAIDMVDPTVDAVLSHGKGNFPRINKLRNIVRLIPDYNDSDYAKSTKIEIPPEFFKSKENNE